MFSEEQKYRIASESAALQDFIRAQDRMTIIEMKGDPTVFYRIGFHQVRTTVVENVHDLRLPDQAIQIMPVSFEAVVNLGERYPNTVPDIHIGPALDASGKIHHLYNSHILFFVICIFSQWKVGYSLVDAVQRIWNVVTYNHGLLNLDQKDCINSEALDWYKRTVQIHSEWFPSDAAMESIYPETGNLVNHKRFMFSD